MVQNLGLEELKLYVHAGNGLLVFSPHPDDSAFVAGTISQLTADECSVYICLITAGQAGYLKASQEVDNRVQEFINECAFTKSKPFFLSEYLEEGVGENKASLIDGETDANNIHFLSALIKVIRKLKPSVIFIPSEYELHRDHLNVNKAVKYAIWRSGRFYKEKNLGKNFHYPYHGRIYEYEIMRLMPERNLVYVDITGEFWRKKLDALCKHTSQINKDKTYLDVIDMFSSLRGRELYGSKQTEQLLNLRDLQISDSDQITQSRDKILKLFRENGPKAEAFRYIGI